ncbi:MAG: hypothetical protein QXU18_06040 [Thermoplasmatales archaeon]
MELDSVAFELGEILVGGVLSQALGTVYANITIGSYTESWSHTFNYVNTQNSYFATITPVWNFYDDTPWFLVSNAASAYLKITATSYDGTYVDAPTDTFSTTEYRGQNSINSGTSTTVDTIPWALGHHYGSSTSTFTPASDLTSFDVSWTGQLASTTTTYNSVPQTGSSGTFTGALNIL